jgi:ATP-dependent DNA helicase
MNCKLIKELMTYNSANRLLITGTPLQNNISELWSLLHFLLPEVFNDLKSFESWFDFSSVLDDSGKAEVIERRKRNLVTTMHSILKPFLLRRVKTDVEHSLPKKREYILYAPLTPEQKELYREILSGTGRQYLEGKALERLTAKSKSSTPTRSRSLKRRRSSDGSETPNKSRRTARDSEPASGTASARRRRGPQNYKDISDREFNSKLRKLEQGVEEEEEEISEPNDTELEEIERANNLKLASTFATAIHDYHDLPANEHYRERNQPEEDDESHHASPPCLQLSPQLLLALDGRILNGGRNPRNCIGQDAPP